MSREIIVAFFKPEIMGENFDGTASRMEIKNRKLKERLEEKKKEAEQMQQQLVKANKTIHDLQSEIESLKSQPLKKNMPDDGYNAAWSWVSKIVFIIAQANKPLRSVEIITSLSARETELSKKNSKEKFISLFLNSAVQHLRIMPYKLKGVRGNYYCLPEWINGQSGLLPEMKQKIF